MVLNLKEFLKAPDARVIETWKKMNSLNLYQSFTFNIKPSDRKVEIRNAVVQHLVEQEILGDSALSMVAENELEFNTQKIKHE